MQEEKLKIVYTGELNEKLDKAIEKFAKSLGYQFEGSGYEFAANRRDISFYKKRDNLRMYHKVQHSVDWWMKRNDKKVITYNSP